MAYTHIKPGEEIELTARIYGSDVKEDIIDLVTLPMAELFQKKKKSEEAEKTIFAKFDALVDEWYTQAKETVQLRKALEYCKTLSVGHTANKWVTDQYDRHEISNMVYKMTWRLYERTEWSKAMNRSIPIAWELSWGLYFNTPQNTDDTRTGLKIAGQEKKVFKDKATLNKYLQGRITAYAHLFQEISPPIPKGEAGRFSVNGVLLPGYAVEVPEQTPKEAADELLALLGDEDIPLTQPPEPKAPSAQPTPKKAPAHKPKKHAPTR